MDKEKVKQLVVFSILMANDEGIQSKAPTYIMEKYNACMNDNEPEAWLDYENLAKYEKWMTFWMRGE